MHVQVLAEPAEEPDYAQAAFVAAEDPAAGLGELAQGAAGVPSDDSTPAPVAAPTGAPPAAAGGSGAAGAQVRSPNRGAPNRGGNGAAGPAQAGSAQRPVSGAISPTGSPLGAGPPAKVGRNEPCWCGSGRKFKVCHGAS
jgi:preprotein translocase subunit SecA